MRNTLRMWYYLPGQSELFSVPYMFETNNGNEWGRAVNIAHEKGYKFVKVEIVKRTTAQPGGQKSGRK